MVISLLFGDALNTPEIEFGLVGGINRSTFLDMETAEGVNNLNLDFYFTSISKKRFHKHRRSGEVKYRGHWYAM